METKIILGVPGLWETERDIVLSIAEKTIAPEGGFLFAGHLLMNTATRQMYEMEIAPYDARMEEAFRLASDGRIPPEELQAIASHRHTLYCLGSDLSAEGAHQMLGVGVALLKAGGIAVKVESSGAAHSASVWQALAESGNDRDLYRAFVTLVGSTAWYHSCGMHNLGLPDTAIPRSLDSREAAELLNRFNLYQLTEQPQIEDGQSFSIDADSPRFRLRKAPCSFYEADDPFHNPFGIWQMTAV